MQLSRARLLRQRCAVPWLSSLRAREVNCAAFWGHTAVLDDTRCSRHRAPASFARSGNKPAPQVRCVCGLGAMADRKRDRSPSPGVCTLATQDVDPVVSVFARNQVELSPKATGGGKLEVVSCGSMYDRRLQAHEACRPMIPPLSHSRLEFIVNGRCVRRATQRHFQKLKIQMLSLPL